MQLLIGIIMAFVLPAGFVALWVLDYKEDEEE